MPIINIKTLPLADAIDTSKILCKLTEKTAGEIGYDVEEVWATWEFLRPDNYAVGRKLSENQTSGSHFPLVRILAFEGKSQDTIEKMMKKVAQVVSEGLNIDIKNVLIEYNEARSGRIFSRGKII